MKDKLLVKLQEAHRVGLTAAEVATNVPEEKEKSASCLAI